MIKKIINNEPKNISSIKKIINGELIDIKRVYKGDKLVFFKGLLPKEYQQVEYIDTNNGAYIQTNTPINILTNPTFEQKWQMLGTGDKFWFGTRIPSGDYSYSSILWNFSTPMTMYIRWGNTSYGDRRWILKGGRTNFRDLYFYDAPHILKVTGAQHVEIFKDNDLVCTSDENFRGFNSSEKFCIGGIGQLPARNKIYFSKLYNEDKLLFDLIPCYRKSDKVAGMYDLVSNTFFTNQGTGEFIVGGDV